MHTDDFGLNVIKNTLRSKGFPIYYEDKYFLRRLSIRMRRNNCDSYYDYNLVLLNDPNELNLLKKDLSINVTNFFRDIEVYQALETIFHSILFSPTNPRRTFRVWAAGCATGEEPYSIAMMLDQVLVRRIGLFNVKILASDLNEDSLSIARRGIYTKDQLKDLPAKYATGYFDSLSGDQFRISYRIKRFVDFFYHDLGSNQIPFSNFDMILCRNVMIYFSQQAHQQILDRLYSALNPEGLLVLGQTEVLHHSYRHYFIQFNPRLRIYQKASRSPSSINLKSSILKEHTCSFCKKRFESFIKMRIHERSCTKKSRTQI